MLAILAAIDGGTVTDSAIEHFSRRWISTGNSWACILEASVVAVRCANRKRIDLAAFTGLALIRAAWFRAHGTQPVDDDWQTVANLGQEIFATQCAVIWNKTR